MRRTGRGRDREDAAESRRLTERGAGAIVHFDGGSLATYAQMVLAMDVAHRARAGRARACGWRREQIVDLTSDNGGERFSDTWPFSGKKTECSRRHRDPAIVRWPGVVHAGQPRTRPSSRWTGADLLAAAGAERRFVMPPDGIDIVPQLRATRRSRASCSGATSSISQQAMRDGDWKYPQIRDNTFCVFDVVDDRVGASAASRAASTSYERSSTMADASIARCASSIWTIGSAKSVGSARSAGAVAISCAASCSRRELVLMPSSAVWLMPDILSMPAVTAATAETLMYWT